MKGVLGPHWEGGSGAGTGTRVGRLPDIDLCLQKKIRLSMNWCKDPLWFLERSRKGTRRRGDPVHVWVHCNTKLFTQNLLAGLVKAAWLNSYTVSRKDLLQCHCYITSLLHLLSFSSPGLCSWPDRRERWSRHAAFWPRYVGTVWYIHCCCNLMWCSVHGWFTKPFSILFTFFFFFSFFLDHIDESSSQSQLSLETGAGK